MGAHPLRLAAPPASTAATVTLRIPAEVVAAVREHAVQVDAEQPDHEAVGVLVLDADGNVERYTRLANADPRPECFRIAAPERLRRRGRHLIPTHSHPRSPARPSPEDVAGARSPESGIYSLIEDRLTVWWTSPTGWTPIPFQIVS
jgi:proteasome lid subunit RPN8/RPN11